MQALLGMADSGGFEPPTARFVAEYSIQLSYESIKDHPNANKLSCDLYGVFRPDHHWLEQNDLQRCMPFEYGGLRRIRTSDRSVRSRVLYPAEL